MAVNTAALKTFAPAMRRQLMEAVGRKLDLLLNSQTPDTLSTYAKQIAELRNEQEKSREQLLERVAYTWFNRLCALRYLDAKGWHPFGCKVLMPADDSETQPELLKLMRSGSLPTDLKTFTSEQRLNQLLDGQIPTAIPGGDAQGEVYRELVLAACRSYHNLLPDLFEGLDDASELLLPDDLLTEGSIAGSFRSSISDSDCDDVEIIGWLYQFYISEKKDEVIGKVIKSEDIPAATQLFTPNWIVKYLVQNTIGAQWLGTHPDSPLRGQMKFYIEPAKQTDEVKAKLAEITPASLNPEELTLMDPACGSGHILVEAYEIFKAIYLEQGYQLREIPKLILERNLFGLDIDKRAAQLTIFTLLMKGRSDDRRLFDRGVKLNVVALRDSTNFDVKDLENHINLSEYGLQLSDLAELKSLFCHATTLGSLIKVPKVLREKIADLIELGKSTKLELLTKEASIHLDTLTRQAQLLIEQYDAVVTNPPYMGSKGMNTMLKEFVKKSFPDAKSDLFSCFIQQGLSLAKLQGHAAMVTMQSWMFLSSFQSFRERLLAEKTITTMAHLDNGVMGIAFGTAATVFRNRHLATYKGQYSYTKIDDLNGSNEPFSFPTQNARLKQITQEEFKKIPGRPIAYWLSDSARSTFDSGRFIKSVATTRVGMATGDNERFVRLWFEVSHSGIGFGKKREEAKDSGKRWFPYSNGGEARKWYANYLHVVDWQNDGHTLQTDKHESGRIRAHNFNLDRIFTEGLTWSLINVAYNAIRILPAGFLFSSGSPSLFCDEARDSEIILGFYNSSVAQYLLHAINPTVNNNSGDADKLPLCLSDSASETVRNIVGGAVLIAKRSWDAYEESWDFQALPLCKVSTEPAQSLSEKYVAWTKKCKNSISDLRRLEEDNNRVFIDSYGLSKELSSEVPAEQITLAINPAHRYGGDGTTEEKWKRFQRDSIAELLSYATGCMMGRYSLDHPGLILADARSNQDDQLAAYEATIGKKISEIQYQPDADAIIPVLDGEWFEDDIVARTREFLKVTFPESSMAENLRFIEDSIGKDIRKYFCKDFYKDHLQTYKKRPIYWMVQSPKAGFACLIYLHRYTPDTLLQVLNNYFRPYLQKLEARQEQLEREQNNEALPKREQTAARKEAEKITKVLKECQAWEQDALLPLAQQRIELDLDDGVKVNYLKLQEVLAKIPGLAAKGD